MRVKEPCLVLGLRAGGCGGSEGRGGGGVGPWRARGAVGGVGAGLGSGRCLGLPCG